MKKQRFIALVAILVLFGGLRVFQEHAESLSGEVVSFIFAFSCAIVFGLIGYFMGYKKPLSTQSVQKERTGMKKQNAILLGLVALLMFAPLTMHSAADFRGADDQTTAMISAVRPGYEAWVNPVFEPSEDAEPWLFGIQAGLGAGVVCYILGYFRGVAGAVAMKA